ncbi:hypothetical protein Btru_047298 [Bulinus truncatus]|nr:hypothetical protein Btru_047298 [Bulinus truncatus]
MNCESCCYERYDHNRHIAYQGRKPRDFILLFLEKINKLREYKLPSDKCLNKFMGAMQKEEFENNEIRQEHLVSSGPVELLTLCKQDYFRLLHTTPGLPVEFLLSIDLFREFPARRSFYLMRHPLPISIIGESPVTNESLIIVTYPSLVNITGNKVICSDVTKTPWLHVVKSGQVKLVRSQYVYDTSRDSLFQEDKLEPE